MRPVNARRLNYKDEAMRRHRRIFILKIVATIIGVIIVVAGLIYLLFFSRIFDVREVSFSGLDTVNSDEFQVKINEHLNQKLFKFLPRKNNIFFVDTAGFEATFSSAYPVLKSVDIQKNLLHGLVLNFLERKPAGIWCFKDVDCSYFDNDKVLWGQPAKSSGYIFLTIEDQRNRTTREVDDDFFGPIIEVAGSMSGEIKNIIIPEDSFNELRVYTANYYIIFSTESDIKDQLDVLKIFMNDKIKSPDFNPQYIDLRIDGRVYYK